MERGVILFISSLGKGGAERVCCTLANELCNSGWTVTILVVRPLSYQVSYSLDKRVRLITLNSPRARFAILSLASFMMKEKPSRLVIFNYETLLIWYFFSAIFPFKTNVLFRNVNTISAKFPLSGLTISQKVRFGLIKLAIKKCDHVVVQCKEMRRDLLQQIPKLNSSDISVIYNPVVFPTETLVSHKKFNSKVVVCVASFSRQKRIDRAIRTFHTLAIQRPNIELWLAGDGPEREMLQTLVCQLDIAKRVIFLGIVDDVSSLYLNADCLLLTSDYEGFPNVICEALAHGVPVVSLDCPSGPSELIKDGRNGFLVDFADEKGLAVALENCLYKSDWDPVKICSTVRHLSIEKIARLYMDVLRSL